jgi:AcrR family transcriptional regulator
VIETDEPPHSRRERRATARRTQILNAATHLFSERGFDHTTTRDIAAAADVSEGTLYNYFDTKDQMLLSIMSRLGDSQQLAAKLIDSLPQDAREFLHEILYLRKDFVDQNFDMLRSVVAETLVHPELRQQYYQDLLLPNFKLLEDHLQARRNLEQIRDVDVSLAARMLVAITTGLFFLNALGDPLVKDRWAELAQLITSIFFDGVAPA